MFPSGATHGENLCGISLKTQATDWAEGQDEAGWCRRKSAGGGNLAGVFSGANTHSQKIVTVKVTVKSLQGHWLIEDPGMPNQRPIVTLVRFVDEAQGQIRATWLTGHGYAKGTPIKVEVDGKIIDCVTVGSETWGVCVERV